MTRRDDFISHDVFSTHSGRDGGNKVDKHIALSHAGDHFALIKAGKLILTEELKFRAVPEGELFPASPACTEITAVTQHAYKDRAGVAFPQKQIDDLVAEVQSGKREYFGVKYEALAFRGNPRTETYRSYVS